MRATWGLCKTCAGIVPAAVDEAGESIVIHKTCATHGRHSAIMEPNGKFYRKVMSLPHSVYIHNIADMNTSTVCPDKTPLS